jgi:hypothetical protein
VAKARPAAISKSALIRFCVLLAVVLSPAVHAQEHAAGNSGGSAAQAQIIERDINAPPAKPGETRLHFKVSHSHSRAEARARVGYLFDYWKKRFGVVSRWEGDKGVATGNIMGITFTAWFEVTDTSVGGDTTDPGFFTRGIAYAYIDKKLKKYMNPTYDDP